MEDSLSLVRFSGSGLLRGRPMTQIEWWPHSLSHCGEELPCCSNCYFLRYRKSRQDSVGRSIVWKPVILAPYCVELELAIIDDEGEELIYELPCRRTVTGWIDTRWLTPIDFKPTHCRPFIAKVETEQGS